MSQNRELNVSLLEVLELLVRGRWFILGFTFVITLGVAIYSLVVSPKYMARVVIMPPSNSEAGSLASIIKNTPLGKIGGLDAITQSMPNDKTNVYMAILGSRSLRLDLIKKFDLVKVYKYDSRPKYYIEDLIKEVDNHFDYDRLRLGTLYVSVIDKDPKRAAAMAGYVVTQLDSIYKRLVNEKNRNYRVFLGERLDLVKLDLEKSEKELVAFQKKHRMIDLESQAKATVSAGVNLEARYVMVKGNLEVARQIYSDAHPKVRELKIQLEQLEDQRRRLAGDKVSDFLIPYQQGPDIALDYLRLQREQEIQQAIFELMVQQYEEAKFEESRNTPNVQVLDAADVPQKKVFPKRRKMVQIAFALSLLTGAALVLLAEGVRRFRRTRPEDSARIGRIVRQAWAIRNR
jgi:uncharacterized protein involved in exopolysaccharide biosynthesis